MEMEETIRVNITVSGYVYRKLTEWGKIHGKPPTTFAGQIVSSRVESNIDVIEQQKADIAHYKGISVEELENQWSGESEN